MMPDDLYAKIKAEVVREYNDLCYIKRFEPNDQVAREYFRSAIEAIILRYEAEGFVRDHKTVCDDTNNTPEMRDHNLPPVVDVYYTKNTFGWNNQYAISLKPNPPTGATE